MLCKIIANLIYTKKSHKYIIANVHQYYRPIFLILHTFTKNRNDSNYRHDINRHPTVNFSQHHTAFLAWLTIKYTRLYRCWWRFKSNIAEEVPLFVHYNINLSSIHHCSTTVTAWGMSNPQNAIASFREEIKHTKIHALCINISNMYIYIYDEDATKAKYKHIYDRVFLALYALTIFYTRDVVDSRLEFDRLKDALLRFSAFRSTANKPRRRRWCRCLPANCASLVAQDWSLA